MLLREPEVLTKFIKAYNDTDLKDRPNRLAGLLAIKHELESYQLSVDDDINVYQTGLRKCFVAGEKLNG